jgi:CrcB protein
MRIFLLAIGAGIGAPSRYWLDILLKKKSNSDLPLGTLLINTLGSFVLGLVIHSNKNTLLLFGTGFAGAFTTWSTFALESHLLIKNKKHQHALLYLFSTLLFGLSAGALGIYLASK